MVWFVHLRWESFEEEQGGVGLGVVVVFSGQSLYRVHLEFENWIDRSDSDSFAYYLMIRRKFRLLIGVFGSLLMTIPNLLAQDSSAGIEAVSAANKAYVEAFNRADAEGLAKLWTEDGTWSNPVTHETLSGREELKSAFGEFFKEHSGAELQLKRQSVKLLSDAVAVEEGSAEVTRSGVPITITDYTAVFVKTDGAWLLSRVVEVESRGEAPQKGPLSKISWLEGTWVDETEGSSVSYHNEWIAGGRFLRRTFSVVIDGKVDMTGREVVGWDPAAKTIRSWVFDSEGGFAELQWKQNSENPKRWIKVAKGTLGTGEVVSAIHIMTQVDEDHYTFEAVARESDGEIQPNIDEVNVVRAADH